MQVQTSIRDTATQEQRKLISQFSLSERLLFLLSKQPQDVPFFEGNYQERTNQWTLDTALRELEEAFPNFTQLIHGQRVLDYGCGDGYQSVAMARKGAAFVMGIDLSPQRLEHGRKLADDASNIKFGPKAEEGQFDIAISLNSFEHFPTPEVNLREMAAVLRPGGKLLITFGSPWLSPYGSHMNFFTHVPWVNILFSDKTVFRVRQLYRNDGSTSYEPDMNRMTVKKFERIIAASGLTVEGLTYKCVRGLPLTKFPYVRELFINRISCILRK